MINRLRPIGTLLLTATVLTLSNMGIAMSADTELLLIDESVLNGRVIPAVSDFLDRGNSAAARQLVEEAMLNHRFEAAVKSDAAGYRAIAQYLAKGSEDLL